MVCFGRTLIIKIVALLFFGLCLLMLRFKSNQDYSCIYLLNKPILFTHIQLVGISTKLDEDFSTVYYYRTFYCGGLHTHIEYKRKEKRYKGLPFRRVEVPWETKGA